MLRRVAMTVALVGAYRLILQVVTIPGADGRILAEFFSAGSAPAPTLGLSVGLAPTGIGAGATGIQTYVTASVLVLLASGMVPFLRRLREGDDRDAARFDAAIVVLTAVLAAHQGWGQARFLEDLHGARSGLAVVAHPGWGFRLTAMLTLSAAALLVVWLAHLLTWRGLGNGVAVLLAVDLLAPVWDDAVRQWRSWSQAPDPWHQGLRAAALLGLALLVATSLVRARRHLALREVAPDPDPDLPPGGHATPDPESPPAPFTPAAAPPLPLRVDPVGALPAGAALAWLSTATFLADPAGQGSSAAGWDTEILGGALLVALVAGLAYLYAAATFQPRDAVARLRRHGFHLAGAGDAHEAARLLRTVHRRAMVPGVLGLCLLAGAPWIARHGLGLTPGLVRLCGPALLVLAAVILDLRQQERGWSALKGGEWTTALATETRFELDLAAHVLARAGVRSVVLANRVISASGTAAFWEVSRPALPSLTVHRRLGGGAAVLLVPAASAAPARRLLMARGFLAQSKASR